MNVSLRSIHMSSAPIGAWKRNFPPTDQPTKPSYHSNKSYTYIHKWSFEYVSFDIVVFLLPRLGTWEEAWLSRYQRPALFNQPVNLSIIYILIFNMRSILSHSLTHSPNHLLFYKLLVGCASTIECYAYASTGLENIFLKFFYDQAFFGSVNFSMTYFCFMATSYP